MNTKPELAERAYAELTAAADGFHHAGALFRVIFDAPVRCEECPVPDALSPAKIGSELCQTYSGRADDEASYFEEAAISSRAGHDLHSSPEAERE